MKYHNQKDGMLDNLINTEKNPLGGRPARLGSMQVGIFYEGQSTAIMYHLGYCPKCSSYLRVTGEQAQKIVNSLARNGHIQPEKQKSTWFNRVLMYLIPHDWRSAIHERNLTID